MIVDLAIRGKLRCRNLADVNKQEGVLQQSEGYELWKDYNQTREVIFT